MQQQKRRRVRESRARRVCHHDDANITRIVSHNSLVYVSARTTQSALCHLHAKCMYDAPFLTPIPCVRSWAQKMDCIRLPSRIFDGSFFSMLVKKHLFPLAVTVVDLEDYYCTCGVALFDISGEHFRPSFMEELLLGLSGNFITGACSAPLPVPCA